MKPSKVKTLTAKKTWLLLPSFKGITWMGVVYCRVQKYIDEINRSNDIDSNFKSHEMIHVKQAQSMKDSWFRFYCNYVFQYIKNFPLITVDLHAPYRLIPTEIEAYLNQDNWKYAAGEEPVYQWKLYQGLTLKEKREIAIEYFKKKNKTYTTVLHEFFENRAKKIGRMYKK